MVGSQDGGKLFGFIPLPKSSERAMPHTWDMFQRLAEPENRSGDTPIWREVAGYAVYSGRLALIGLAVGAVVGVALAIVMARFTFARRAMLPWIVMSQTVPLIALAPQVVAWSGKIDVFGWEWPRWLSVCVLAAFLSFFPIAVGTLRGLQSAPAASLELMESYASSWWTTLRKLRFPAAVPSMVPALKIGAGLAVVGVIVSEISTGINGGIGRAVLTYGQAATGDPTKVYAAVFGAAALGLVMFGLVVAIDVWLMRRRPRPEPS